MVSGLDPAASTAYPLFPHRELTRRSLVGNIQPSQGVHGMRVVGRQRLDDFWCAHPEAKGRTLAWLAETESAEWTSPHDIRERYPSASMLGNGRVVFNLGGNRWRIDVKISYAIQQLLIVRVGTHAEYDSWTF